MKLLSIIKRDKKGRFKKGHSGNPKGRLKKGETLTDALRGLINKNELAKQLKKLAQGGNLGAIKYVYDRVDGRPKEQMEISGDVDKPMGIVFLPTKMTPEQWMKNGNRESLESAAETEDSS